MTTPEDPAAPEAVEPAATAAPRRPGIAGRLKSPLGAGLLVAVVMLLFGVIPAAVVGAFAGAEFSGHHGSRGDRDEHGRDGQRGDRHDGNNDGSNDRDSDRDGSPGGVPPAVPSPTAVPSPSVTAVPTPTPTT